MPEYLSGENLRWAIGILVTILLAVASLTVPSLLSRRQRTLWYRESSYPLVERVRTDERVEILFDGESVPDVYISVIGLWYRGTSAIVEDNYRTPVTVDFGEARVLDAEIVDTLPEGLPAELSVEAPQKVTFSPVAMNDGNVVKARVLLTSRRKKPKITGHIVDARIRDHREHKTFPDLMIRALFAMMATGIALFFIGTVLALLFSSDNFVPKGIVLVMFSGIGLLGACTLLMLPTMVLFERSIDKSPI
jgi:hypothetical protein